MRSIISSSRGSTLTDDRKSVVSGHSSNASTLVQDSVKSGGLQLRKFTAGVGRPGLAREAREAVRNVISTQNPSRVPPIAPPLDYERFITERNIQLENDPQRDLLLFPRDDVEEVLKQPEHSTVVPTVTADDIAKTQWLLTKEAISFYSSQYHTICFNYGKFSGDFNKVNQGSTLDSSATLSSLVFESDLALEEEKAFNEGFHLTDIVKEGYVMVVKTDLTLLTNLKSAKKRYCILRREEGGDIVIEIRKTPSEQPKQPAMKVNSAQLRSTKKGKPVLEIEPFIEDSEKTEQAKPFTIVSDDTEEINSWLLNINRAIALSAKLDSISSCSEKLNRSYGGKGNEVQPDSISTTSEDSSASRDTMLWRGRGNAARVLHPPIVERHNMFSLYYKLAPLAESKLDKSHRNRWNCTPESPALLNSSRCLDVSRISLPAGQACRFAVKFEDLTLKLPVGGGLVQQIEPFYISLFIFDAQAGRRLSEEFHIDATGDDKPKEISGNVRDPVAACLTLATSPKIVQALFTVAAPHKDIWMVCRVDRALSSDTAGDIYMKSSPDSKAVQKVQKTIQASSPRLSGYRQRFAWGARAIFADSKSDVDSGIQLFRCENNRLTESDLQKFLNDFARLEKGKSAIPNASVSVDVDLSASPSDFNCRVNPSMLPLRPWSIAGGEPIFDLQSFGDIVLDPHTELVNLLYIYPLSLKYDSQKLFSKARNITCSVRFVRGDDKVANKAVVDRLMANGPFVSHASCAVQHHQQVPTFGDEIKMRLPLSLSASDHLLFSFTHVSVSGQNSAKSPENHETPIGYAWLPLVWKKDRLVMEADEQDFALPVAVELPSGYLRTKQHGVAKDDTEIRWVDQRPLFRFRLRLVSSAFTTEGKLQAFFQACQKLENRGIVGDATDQVKVALNSSIVRKESKETVGDSEPHRSCSPLARYASFNAEHPVVDDLIKKTESLVDVPIEKLLPFLPVLLSRLFALLPHAPSDVLALSTMSTVISICDRCLSAGRRNLLRTYIRLHFVAGEEGDETVHSSICRFLPAVIRGSQNSSEYAVVFRQLWFLLDLASKSLAQTIVHRSLYKVVRKERVTGEVLEIMGSMVETIATSIVSQHRELPEECRAANAALAHFIRSCLSFLDRGSVFQWIYFLVKCYDENDSKVLREYKITLLTVICQHEHWLPLNLPVLLDSNNQIQRINYQSVQQEAITTTGGGFVTRFLNQLFQNASPIEITESDRYACCTEEWRLSEAYASRHFLVGLLLQELKACLRESRDFRRQPFAVLRNLLAKHSFDKRYSDMSMQQRIAILYVPLVRFAVDIVHELQSVIEDSKDTPGLRTLTRPFECRESPTRTPLKSPSPIDTPLAEKLDSEEVRDFLISVLYVIHRLPRRILSAVWLETDGARALSILNLLEIAAKVFSYRGRSHAISVTKPKNIPSLNVLAPASSRLNSLADLNISNVTDSGKDDNDPSLPFAVLQLLNLSQEVALIVLEALQSLSRTFAVKYSRTITAGEKHDIFVRLLSLHLGFLAENWPESVRLHAIAAIAVFVNLFRNTLFEGGPLDALSILIEHVLLQMASRLPSIQSSAAALLQLILRSGYEAVQAQLANHAMALSVLPSTTSNDSRQLSPAERLGRPGAQTGVALARLLGTQSALSSSGRLEKGLGALESLVVTDARKATIFDKAVLELLKQLRGVMLATVALKDAAQDSIRLAELHIQLADSYRGSAALRSAWFDTLAQVHSGENWHSEAAVSHAHSVAIIAKELMEKGELDLDWSIFDWISKEICEEEKGLSKERTVQPAGFTLENLVHKIEKTAQSLTLAERYEAIGPLYGVVLLPLHRKCVFNSLVSIYAELQQTYSRAAEVKLSGKRHLGAYFRVRFLGGVFEADNGTEWIYREAGLTSLAEVSLRMQDACRAKGFENVQIASENEKSFVNNNDTGAAFLQITHVEPCLKDGQRAKDFWSHTNIKKFVYETSVMEESCNAEADVSITGQALKRVVLEVSGHFPCSRRRLRVISRSEEVFNPLRFACQKLATKAEQMQAALDAPSEGRPMDIKGLQLLLQGAVMPTVNAGPLAYAEAFTQPGQRKRYGEEGISLLVESFRNLMSACESALHVNKTAIGSDQQTYHEVLMSSFEAMHERLQLFFGQSLRPLPDDERKGGLPISAIHILDSIGGVHT